MKNYVTLITLSLLSTVSIANAMQDKDEKETAKSAVILQNPDEVKEAIFPLIIRGRYIGNSGLRSSKKVYSRKRRFEEKKEKLGEEKGSGIEVKSLKIMDGLVSSEKKRKIRNKINDKKTVLEPIKE